MGKQTKMQTKIQTILFFTFLICVHISITNTLKIKSKFLSTAKPSNATLTAAPAGQEETRDLTVTKGKRHHREPILPPTDLKAFTGPDSGEHNTDNHKKQFHIHHVTPRNTSSLNDKVANRFQRAHKRLAEIDDLRKENEERKLLKHLPKKPKGITSIGILNLKLRHISKQTKNFHLSDVEAFQAAFNKALAEKTSKVEVNGGKWRIKQVGNNFWYAAVVNGGGLGIMKIKGYVLVMTHNINITLENFARYFEEIKHKFENNEDQLRVIYLKDHEQEQSSVLKKRLRHDKHLYDQNK